jgi:hypothetical protein
MFVTCTQCWTVSHTQRPHTLKVFPSCGPAHECVMRTTWETASHGSARYRWTCTPLKSLNMCRITVPDKNSKHVCKMTSHISLCSPHRIFRDLLCYMWNIPQRTDSAKPSIELSDIVIWWWNLIRQSVKHAWFVEKYFSKLLSHIVSVLVRQYNLS